MVRLVLAHKARANKDSRDVSEANLKYLVNAAPRYVCLHLGPRYAVVASTMCARLYNNTCGSGHSNSVAEQNDCTSQIHSVLQRASTTSHQEVSLRDFSRKYTQCPYHIHIC